MGRTARTRRRPHFTAFSGLAHLTGLERRSRTFGNGHRRLPLWRCLLAGHHLLAVGRVATGRGDVIDASLYGAALRITEWAVPAADRLGTDRTREGISRVTLLSRGLLIKMINTSPSWAERRQLSTSGDAMQDPHQRSSFKTPSQRSQQADELNAMVRAWPQR